jgi:hypothetical protein
MAGRKLTIAGRARASTVLEVVISMVIIIIVFGIAMMIYGNVTRMSLSGQKIRAEAVLAEVMRGMQGAEPVSDTETIIAGFTIKRSVKTYAENGKLLQVELKAYDENHQVLAELNELILANHDQ